MLLLFFFFNASLSHNCGPAATLVFESTDHALFSLKISLISSQISLLTSVPFPFPRLQSGVRVRVDLVIICPAICCSYHSWTEALKLRNYELSCSQHPWNGFVCGKAWELLVSKGLIYHNTYTQMAIDTLLTGKRKTKKHLCP